MPKQTEPGHEKASASNRDESHFSRSHISRAIVFERDGNENSASFFVGGEEFVFGTWRPARSQPAKALLERFGWGERVIELRSARSAHCRRASWNELRGLRPQVAKMQSSTFIVAAFNNYEFAG